MREEIWKDIEGYEGKYQVSNRGNAKSLNYRRTGKEKILKAIKNSNGYLQVFLWKDGKMKTYKVHQLVATAFIPNPENLPEINHKSEDKTDNRVENLEWCTSQYNINYGTRNQRAGKKVSEKLRGRKLSEEHIKKMSKPVIAIHKINGLILEFSSIMEASRQTGIDQSNITRCCQGKYKTSGGFYWMYK